MGFAIKVLGWTPATFWAATPHEVWSAYELIEDEARAIEEARED